MTLTLSGAHTGVGAKGEIALLGYFAPASVMENHNLISEQKKRIGLENKKIKINKTVRHDCKHIPFPSLPVSIMSSLSSPHHLDKDLV